LPNLAFITSPLKIAEMFYISIQANYEPGRFKGLVKKNAGAERVNPSR
jgi:hypothetical protein